jgi:hypothetical protein
MTENERLANELVVELQRAIHLFLMYEASAEQFLSRLKLIFRASSI